MHGDAAIIRSQSGGGSVAAFVSLPVCRWMFLYVWWQITYFAIPCKVILCVYVFVFQYQQGLCKADREIHVDQVISLPLIPGKSVFT